MVDASQNVLLQYGIAGVVIIASWFALWRLFGLYTKSMEARLLDSRQTQEAINNNTRALENHTKSVDTLVSLLRARP